MSHRNESFFRICVIMTRISSVSYVLFRLFLENRFLLDNSGYGKYIVFVCPGGEKFMDIGVRDAAGLLNVSEKTIYRWIKDSKLPAFKVNEQYRFNRSEILEWVTSQRVNVSAEIFSEPANGKLLIPGLEDALRAGGIHYRVEGADKNSALKSAIDIMPLPEEVDKPFLLRVLLARESLGSTGFGNGIAIPHVRNPIVMHIPRPMITLCFLETPVDFDALDGKPVNTLFTMVSPTISAHLNLLSKLAFALRYPGFATVITKQGSREEILKNAHEIDNVVPHKVKPAEGDV
jgi:nitrogen PTS system EIIA component